MLTPSLGRSIPGHKSEFGLGHANRLARARQHLLSAKDLKLFSQDRASCTELFVAVDPLGAQASESLNQQGLSGQGLIAIDQVIKAFVVLA